MTQTRFHVTAAARDAERIFARFEQAFEEEGFPLAIVDMDEARGLKEVSLYSEVVGDGLEARIIEVVQDEAPGVTIGRELLPDVDWVARSLEGLGAVRAGRFLVHGSHDRHRRRTGDLGIEIEAGLAFGTGHHGTTVGCLEMLDRVARSERPRYALDLGTGSAVLAIALAKLCRIPVLATDIDPVATRVASANARQNGVAAFVETVTAPGFQAPVFAARAPFDLILANILARPLMELAPGMARYVRQGGSVVLSGILERQRPAVLAAYVGQRFRHALTLRREGWVTLHLKR